MQKQKGDIQLSRELARLSVRRELVVLTQLRLARFARISGKRLKKKYKKKILSVRTGGAYTAETRSASAPR
jgi:hypothetical protein